MKVMVRYIILQILDLKTYFSTKCDDKNNIKKTSKKVEMETFFTYLPLSLACDASGAQ